jgi:hypothetical protein
VSVCVCVYVCVCVCMYVQSQVGEKEGGEIECAYVRVRVYVRASVCVSHLALFPSPWTHLQGRQHICGGNE